VCLPVGDENSRDFQKTDAKKKQHWKYSVFLEV